MDNEGVKWWGNLTEEEQLKFRKAFGWDKDKFLNETEIGWLFEEYGGDFNERFKNDYESYASGGEVYKFYEKYNEEPWNMEDWQIDDLLNELGVE